MELCLGYNLYHSMVSEGQRVRRMRRTELSYDKICYIHSPRITRPTSRASGAGSLSNKKKALSLPKVERTSFSKTTLLSPSHPNPNTLPRDEYYQSTKRPETVPTPVAPNGSSAQAGALGILSDTYELGQSKGNLRSYMQSKISSKVKGSVVKDKPRSRVSRRSRRTANSRVTNSNLQIHSEHNNADGSQIQRSSFISSRKQNSRLVVATVRKSQISPDYDVYEVKKTIVEPSNSRLSVQAPSARSSRVRKVKPKTERSDIYKTEEAHRPQDRSAHNLEHNISQSGYMLKSSMLDSEMGKPEEDEANFSRLNATNPILHSSNLKEENWKDTIKSINMQGQNSAIKNKASEAPNHIEQQKLSLKLDSVRNDYTNNLDSSREGGRTSFRNLPLASKEPNGRMNLEPSEAACRDCIEDVSERIILYDSLLELIGDFSERLREMSSIDGETEVLCFLLDKKYLFEKSNLLKSLKGQGKNVFTLESVEIPAEILPSYINHPVVVEFVQKLQQANLTFYKSFSQNAKILKKKMGNDPMIDYLIPNDKFTNQLVRRLVAEIGQVHRGLSSLEEEDELDDAEDMIIETMELVFFFSELRGRKVKRMEFPEYVEDFEDYYDTNLPKLEATAKFFRDE